jgi:site-specific DNA recombinase
LTERQQERGTIGSQLELLRQRVATEGDECVAEFCEDGCSGARLDRPRLDALRDAVEAGLVEAVWCLSPDRLARVYAYQVIVLDELARHGASVRFTDAPPLDDDPQAKLLTQVQGVIAEYERAKIDERYRRGKLFRSRAGEVLAWRAPYGYRRILRDQTGPARLEVYEPEAVVVRRIFDDYVAGGHSVRQIAGRLAADGVPTPRAAAGCWAPRPSVGCCVTRPASAGSTSTASRRCLALSTAAREPGRAPCGGQPTSATPGRLCDDGVGGNVEGRTIGDHVGPACGRNPRRTAPCGSGPHACIRHAVTSPVTCVTPARRPHSV